MTTAQDPRFQMLRIAVERSSDLADRDGNDDCRSDQAPLISLDCIRVYQRTIVVLVTAPLSTCADPETVWS